jgi:hypothetical protein
VPAALAEPDGGGVMVFSSRQPGLKTPRVAEQAAERCPARVAELMLQDGMICRWVRAGTSRGS